MTGWHANTLAELSAALQKGSVSSVELTGLYLARIAQHQDCLLYTSRCV